MYRKIRFLLILSCLAVFVQANAQFDDPKTIEIGPHVGLGYYMGDINPNLPMAQSDLEYGGVVRLNWDSRWTFRFDYSHATVKADDAVVKWRPERGLSFTTNLNDFSFVAEFNFLEYYTGNPKRNVSPYIFGGISVFQYTPYQRIFDDKIGLDTLVNLRNYKLDTIYRSTKPGSDELTFSSKLAEFFGGRTNKVGVSIPFGVGVKFSLSQHMAATLEWRMQKTLTDYLDGIGGVYLADNPKVTIKGKDFYLSDPTGNYVAGQQRGDSSSNDWFGMLRVSLTWKFNLPDGRGCNLSKF